MARLKKNEVILRDHVYDGIQEYDQHLPNWWLFTLYGAIVFTAVYWFWTHQSAVREPPAQRIQTKMAEIEAVKLASSIDVTNNDNFWQMAANPGIVAAGEKTFQSTCVACHGADLKGGIGVNLVDNQWKHGHLPANIYVTVDKGVPEKGMQAWGNVLGQKKITEVVAYILSKHGDRAAMEANAVVDES